MVHLITVHHPAVVRIKDMKTRDYFDTLYWLLINAFDVVDDPILHKCAMQKYKEFVHSNEVTR